MDFDEIKASFLVAVNTHDMHIDHEDGAYRHIIFKRHNSSTYRFELITFPGYLTIVGDMGTFVFRRVHDMFTFFRDDQLRINPGYWGEKLQASDKHDGYRKWSPEKFEEAVRDQFEMFFDDQFSTGSDEANAVWEQVKEDVLYYKENEWEAYNAIEAFSTGSIDEDNLFQDFWEYNTKEFTYHYIWCLYAIVWGIQRYDSVR